MSTSFNISAQLKVTSRLGRWSRGVHDLALQLLELADD